MPSRDKALLWHTRSLALTADRCAGGRCCCCCSCLALSCLAVSCLVLPCAVVSCRVVSCRVLPCLVLRWERCRRWSTFAPTATPSTAPTASSRSPPPSHPHALTPSRPPNPALALPVCAHPLLQRKTRNQRNAVKYSNCHSALRIRFLPPPALSSLSSL
eukprot:1525295-Rhodomonas_salina.1